MIEFVLRCSRPISCLLLALIFFAAGTSVWAVPLKKYRENVSRAKILLDSLQPSAFDEATATASRAATERETIAEIRRLLPGSETVEAGDQTFEVNNDWLENNLREFEKLYTGDEYRYKLLSQMTERLGAIEDRLIALENAQFAERTKNQDKQKLDEILRQPEFRGTEEREKSVIERWYDAFLKWWRDLFKSEEVRGQPARPNTDLSSLASILRIVVIGLAVAVIVFVIWRFALPMFGVERRRRKKRTKPEPRIILGEKLEADENAESLLSQAEKLALAGDVRAAIRKGYIALLCDLSDRKLVGLARHKTNRDYLRDVQKNPELFKAMKTATGSFERHWYGFVPADEEDWRDFRGNYSEAVKSK